MANDILSALLRALKISLRIDDIVKKSNQTSHIEMETFQIVSNCSILIVLGNYIVHLKV